VNAPTVPRERFDALLTRIREHAGLRFPDELRPDMEGAARRAMLKAGVASLEDYLAQVADGRVPLSGLVEEIAVGETYFFREPEQFAFLRDVVLPEIAARRGGAPIRLWSAGCSSGEEPYSLAILLEELGLAPAVYLLATDISQSALARARLGEYLPWSLRGAGAARARRYLVEEGETSRLEAKIRGRVCFQQLNLAKANYPSPRIGIYDFDLILCRNVLIYFDPKTVAQVAQRLYESLAEGGWLITASSDPLLADVAAFHVVATDRGVFYRKLTESVTAKPRTESAYSEWRSQLTETERTALPVMAEPTRHRDMPAPLDIIPDPDRATKIRTLADFGDLAGAAEAAEDSIRKEPLDAGNAYLYAAILSELHRDEEAVAALRRALYLDRSFICAHLALGMALRRLHDDRGARRSFQNVLRLCATMDPRNILPFADGACAGHVAAAAASALSLSSSGKDRRR
jgi:chemotaxis protein methyltransferase CheR